MNFVFRLIIPDGGLGFICCLLLWGCISSIKKVGGIAGRFWEVGTLGSTNKT